jgi:hypothetical protein
LRPTRFALRSLSIAAVAVVSGVLALAAVTSLPASARQVQVQVPDLASTLRAAATYLEQYERDVTAVIAQEDYLQRIPTEARTRRLRSDLLIIAEKHAGWVELRDIFEVDESPVRDRDERIAKLFMKPSPDALQQARRIASEGARFNISPTRFPLSRTLNVPLTALRFLRGPNQRRSTFQLDRVEPSRIVLTFNEQAKPRLIASHDNAAASGSFTLEPASGRVLGSELVLVTERVAGKFTVVYADQPTLKLWLPASMSESYTFGTSSSMDGRATYSKFRMFRVETSTDIGK